MFSILNLHKRGACMKKVLSAILCGLLLTGCGGQTSNDDHKQNALVVGGSTSIQPLMEQLAESYNENEAGRVTVQGGGSSVGIKGTIDGTFTVGMVSRALKEEEAEQLDQTVIALDGIVVIVNKANPVKDITLEQIQKVYTGEITNWKELGGKDQEIAVVSREEGSGTRDGFEAVVGFKTTELVKYAEIQNATGSIIMSVSGNKQAIGYISMGASSEMVRALRVDGVEANEATIKNGSYTLQRPFILCVKKGDTGATNFYDFIFSDAGKKMIQDHKYIPVERGSEDAK